MEYEYLCFTHDKQSYPARNGQSFRYLLWENTLAGEMFIENILHAFDAIPRLGLLSVPILYQAGGLGMFGGTWAKNFQNTKHLAERLALRCKLSESVSTFSIGTAFWCRTAAMRRLFEHNFTLTDFRDEPFPNDGTLSHAIERIFPYVAQHEGYFSGIVMTDRYAAVRMTDFERIFTALLNRSDFELGFFSTIQFVMFTLSDFAMRISNEMIKFCSEFADIYVYGAGKYAAMVAGKLEQLGVDYKGFVVSDGNAKPAGLQNRSVFYFSELDLTKPDTGVILGLGRSNTYEVISFLETNGVKNIYKLF
jgi:rhamnosyltransferase